MLQCFFSVLIVFVLFGCEKYTQPSEPKIQGQWQISRIDFYRIENEDTINELHYYPGDLFVLPNEQHPLDSVIVGTSYFACSGAEIFLKPSFIYGGATSYQKRYFYSIYEVNYEYPGFLVFNSENRKNVWKIISSEYVSGLLLQLKGQWDPNSSAFKQAFIGYGMQSAKKYDALYLQATRIGP
jgi:hypothetical protein